MANPYDLDRLPGLPPSAFDGRSNDSSGDTDEAHSSPTDSSDGSDHDVALNSSQVTPFQNRGSAVLEMSESQWSAYNTTPEGPGHTCGYRHSSGVLCGKQFSRQDRFKYHVHGHVGMKPYACAEKASPELACDRVFSSATGRDTHIKNKKPVTLVCGTKVLPKNCSRHRTTCSTCSSP